MPQLKLQVRHATIGDDLPVVWVSLDGFIDASTVLAFENALQLLAREEKGNIVLDFADVFYANSTAIGTILNYRNLLLEDGRELLLMAVNPQVLTTFDLLGLTAVVPCVADEATALQYLQSAPAGHRDPEAFAARREPAPTPTELRKELPEAPPVRTLEPARCNVLLIAPEENRFTDITKLRLLTPQGRFCIVTDTTEALRNFDEVNPDLIILEDPMHGSEDFLWSVKTERGKSLIPVIKLYWVGTDIESRKDFKIWEDDFLVEPFEVKELFALSEAELRRIPEDHTVLLHQTHFEFRTRKDNVQRANELVGSLLQRSGVNGEVAAAAATAFAEAVENAARHGNHYSEQKTIDVVFLLDREKLSFTIADEGKGFDFRSLLERASQQEPLSEERLRKRRGDLGGIGIALMRRCMDDVDYLGSGHCVRLTKRL